MAVPPRQGLLRHEDPQRMGRERLLHRRRVCRAHEGRHKVRRRQRDHRRAQLAGPRRAPGALRHPGAAGLLFAPLGFGAAHPVLRLDGTALRERRHELDWKLRHGRGAGRRVRGQGDLPQALHHPRARGGGGGGGVRLAGPQRAAGRRGQDGVFRGASRARARGFAHGAEARSLGVGVHERNRGGRRCLDPNGPHPRRPREVWVRVAHVCRVPRGGPWRLPPRGLGRRRERLGDGRGGVLPRAQAVQGPHRGIRRDPGGVGAHGQPVFDLRGGRRLDELHHRQPRGAHGDFLDYEAVVHGEGQAHHPRRHGRVGRGRDLPRGHELCVERLFERAHRHYRGGRQHYDAQLSDHGARHHALPPAHGAPD
mmetsp:Transcript_62326/g.122408  ORF Transcript_62326/g.122408 Transcript_62326/m.122408 type:complete len:367 (-) Transcript_62326:1338-2438(-)